MSVKKYSDFEAASQDLRSAKNHTELIERIRQILELSSRLVPSAIPRGVRKFRTMKEAQSEELTWIRARVEIMRKNRAPSR